MQKTPMTIALAAAGLVVATAGVAAITTSIAPATEQPAVQQTQVEVKAPAETQAAAETPATTETQTQVVVEKTAAPVAPTRVAQPAPVAAASDHEEVVMMRIPFTNHVVRVTNPRFPSAAQEMGELQPEAAIYMAQLEARILAAAKPAPVVATTGTPVTPMPGTEATTALPPQVTAQATPAN